MEKQMSMYLVTAHRTFVGLDANGNLIQVAPAHARRGGLVALDQYADGDIVSKGPLAGYRIERKYCGASFARAGKYLCAESDRARITADRIARGQWETFRTLPADEIADFLAEVERSTQRLEDVVRLVSDIEAPVGIALQKLQMVDAETIRQLSSPQVDGGSCFIVIASPGDPGNARYVVPDYSRVNQMRVPYAVSYVADLLTQYASTSAPTQKAGDESPRSILFQGNDCPIDVPSVSWQTQSGWKDVRVVPDLYYYRAHGYSEFLPRGSPAHVDWAQRKSVIMWRGQTTGMLAMTTDRLDQLPRYQLCVVAKRLGERADVGLTGIVQAANQDEHEKISSVVTASGLRRDFLDFSQFVNYKFVVDIDGNANAWNLVQRLRLGACLLKVTSKWRQWISDRLEPWVHYVPIAEDLSDFEQQADWCLTHDDQARQIAANAREFALSVDFEREMRDAATQLLT